MPVVADPTVFFDMQFVKKESKQLWAESILQIFEIFYETLDVLWTWRFEMMIALKLLILKWTAHGYSSMIHPWFNYGIPETRIIMYDIPWVMDNHWWFSIK